jgi:hypothetical protein
MLGERIAALRQANQYNIHVDRHIIGLPRIIAAEAGRIEVEAPFAIYQTDQERVVGASAVASLIGCLSPRSGIAGQRQIPPTFHSSGMDLSR